VPNICLYVFRRFHFSGYRVNRDLGDYFWIAEWEVEARGRICAMEARTKNALAAMIIGAALIVLFLIYWALTHATKI
jgi:hypothetical protein